MEKLKNHICALLPHTCSAGIAEPKPVTRPEVKLQEITPGITNKPVKKPWSVFEDVYWI